VREREREEKVGSDGETHYTGSVGKKKNTKYLVLKVPRQCPLVLLVGVKHMIRMNLI
jgi:hypothetical protein